MEDYRDQARRRWLEQHGQPPDPPAQAGGTQPRSSAAADPHPDDEKHKREAEEIIDVSTSTKRPRTESTSPKWTDQALRDDDIQLAEDPDEALARRLQEEENGSVFKTDLADEELARRLQQEEESHMSMFEDGATPADQLMEPTPDIHALFQTFNAQYFENKLDTVCVKWGPKMTLCAGLCSYEGKGGVCTIKMSEPLLKYRPTSDLLDTLLHEMIHAYLFVASNKRDHDDHGPLFLEWMHKINKQAGTHISVFHNFKDEVDLYRVHWWKCGGKCQRIIKRAMNRAPGPSDRWWPEHQRQCGGDFVKIKEPPDYQAKGKKRKPAEERPPVLEQGRGAIDKFLKKPSDDVKKPLGSVSPPPKRDPPALAPARPQQKAAATVIEILDSDEEKPPELPQKKEAEPARKPAAEEEEDDTRLVVTRRVKSANLSSPI